MKYQTFYTQNARSQLNQLEVNLRKRIVKKIKFFRQSENPLYYAKKLKDKSIAFRYQQKRQNYNFEDFKCKAQKGCL